MPSGSEPETQGEALARADRLEAEGRYSEALTILADLIERNPNDYRLGYRSASIQIRNSNPREGWAAAQAFEKKYGRRMSSELLYAYFKIISGAPEEALAYIDSADRGWGQSASGRHLRMIALTDLGRNSEARDLLGDADNTPRLAYSREVAREPQDERSMLEGAGRLEAAGADPGKVALFKADWYFKFCAPESGFAVLQAAHEANPQNLKVIARLAAHLDWAGREAEAERLLQAAFEIDPAFSPAAEHLLGIARRRRRPLRVLRIMFRYALSIIKVNR